ncbi:hypothetical protein NFI96_000891 [Prochilodus magdalenae]|nr:hypothetical protein NFI96_000891 [Prochilodus magdalenae]
MRAPQYRQERRGKQRRGDIMVRMRMSAEGRTVILEYQDRSVRFFCKMISKRQNLVVQFNSGTLQTGPFCGYCEKQYGILCLPVFGLERRSYDRALLLCIGDQHKDYSFHSENIPPEILRSPELHGVIIPPARRRRRRRERKQKRGKRAGLRARLQASPYRPAVPSLFLANSRSLVNKMDEIRLRITSNNMNSCVVIITETWLNRSVPDAAIELAGHSVYRADRTEASGKSRGGGRETGWLTQQLEGTSKKGIKEAKHSYKQRIEEHFENNNPRSMWNGIKALTDYKTNTPQASDDTSLPDVLNQFFARFDNQNRGTHHTAPPVGDQTLVLKASSGEVHPAEGECQQGSRSGWGLWKDTQGLC